MKVIHEYIHIGDLEFTLNSLIDLSHKFNKTGFKYVAEMRM